MHEFGLGGIFQKNYQWFHSRDGKTVPFVDGVKVKWNLVIKDGASTKSGNAPIYYYTNILTQLQQLKENVSMFRSFNYGEEKH